MDSTKTGLARPISGRPMSSARMMSYTGLIAPKSSRGKTALRRQIQDKSYFIGLLRAKINEISNEKNLLQKECDIMAKEEARIGVYRQKAETLAKELTDLNLNLLTYNEFLDRTRSGYDITSIRENTSDLKHENEALIANLENDFSQLKSLENVFRKNNDQFQKMVQDLNAIKSRFSAEQESEYNLSQKMNSDLNKECKALENEISEWRSRRSDIESKIEKKDNILRIEMLQLFGKLRQLEKQKSELLNADSSEENERAHWLAQVKRDHACIASLESKIEEMSKSLEDANAEIDFYGNGEKLVKFADLKQKEKTFESFMTTFVTESNDLLGKKELINNEIKDITGKLNRCLKYLNLSKQIGDGSTGRTYNILNELIIQKRKLELELGRNRQAKVKAENEKDVLNSKIDKLQESIDSYSDISKLKFQMESKLAQTKGQAEKVKQDIEQSKLQQEAVKSQIREIRRELERNSAFIEVTHSEDRLREYLRENEKLRLKDSSRMLDELKSIVMESCKKYNQSLLGF